MTRINLVPPRYLTDRHLLAEYREIRHVPASLRRSLKSKKEIVIPGKFTLGKGHVTFFYDKGKYLSNRYLQIARELVRRDFNLSENKFGFNIEIFVDNGFYNDWKPSLDDQKIVSERIKQRISQKSNLYPDKQLFLDYCNKLKI